jgi:hypothetical protein
MLTLNRGAKQMQSAKLVPAQIQLIQQVIDQIADANSDMQFALPAGDVCYRLHSKLSDVVEELELLIQ